MTVFRFSGTIPLHAKSSKGIHPMTDNSASQPVTPERIQRYSWGFAFPLIMKSALANGVFDALDGTTLSIQELSVKTGCSQRGISALTEALTGMELLQKVDGRYQLAEDASAFLVSGKPAYLGEYLQHLTTSILDNWLHLPESVKSGRPAISVNQESSGEEFFENLVGVLFNMNFAAAGALGNALTPRFAGKQIRILDIAAGSGVWGIGISQAIPDAEVTALDFERVLGTTRHWVERFHLLDRYRFVAGDALTADAGNGYDLVVLGHILHSEGKARSRQLLTRVFDQLKPGGTITIAEFLVNQDRTGPMTGLIFTLNMLIHTDNGTTFSFEELKGWLEEIGFVNVRTMEAPAPSPLILADKR
jgi:2-polyprenyl-3-methyl-5-hydroxy-6-metoxy-1,4-benzoquinol methylase